TILLVPQTGQSTVYIAPVRMGSVMNSILSRVLHPAQVAWNKTLRFTKPPWSYSVPRRWGYERLFEFYTGRTTRPGGLDIADHRYGQRSDRSCAARRRNHGHTNRHGSQTYCSLG